MILEGRNGILNNINKIVLNYWILLSSGDPYRSEWEFKFLSFNYECNNCTVIEFELYSYN